MRAKDREGLAIEIAMDHLDEFPDYYEMLELMEDQVLRLRKEYPHHM